MRLARRASVVGACVAVALALASATAGSASAASTAYAWGWNEFGILGIGTGIGTSPDPVPIPGLTGVSSIAGGSKFALALREDGTVDSWGEGFDDVLGRPGLLFGETPEPVTGIETATAIAAGSHFGLALLANHTVEAWGSNGTGQLGNGTFGGETYEPAPVKGLSGVTAIAAGGGTAYALLEGGTVVAWGAGGSGQLGDGSMTGSDEPVAVSGLTGVKAIAAGAQFGEALLEDGEVRAWGSDTDGELGDGFEMGSDVPAPVGESGHPLNEVTAIAAGETHTLALEADGKILAWGDDVDGELGNGESGSGAAQPKPVAVKVVTGATAVSAAGHHSFALLSGGTADAWGGDEFGQVGDGRYGSGRAVSEPVPLACSPAGLVGLAGNFYAGFALGDGSGYDCPVVEEASPSKLPDAGGATVTITGRNFTGASEVFFENFEHSANAEHFEVVSPTEIVAISPPGEYKEASVRVTTAAGTSGQTGGSRVEYELGIASVKPDHGAPAGGTTVTISGEDLAGAKAVRFGSTPATSFKVNNEYTISAVAPAGSGVADVTVETSSGTTPTSVRDQFVYQAAPEWGTCVEVAPHEASFGKNTCVTSSATKNKYEWFPAVNGWHTLAHAGFSVAPLNISLAAGGSTFACTGSSASGSLTGPQQLSLALKLTSCTAKIAGHSASCSSEGAAAGEVRASLEGTLGVISGAGAAKPKVGVAVGSSAPWLQASCGGQAVSVRGAEIAEVKTIDKMASKFTWQAKLSSGHPTVTRFEGGPEVTPQASFAGGAYETTGFAVKSTQTAEEPVELNGTL